MPFLLTVLGCGNDVRGKIKHIAVYRYLKIIIEVEGKGALTDSENEFHDAGLVGIDGKGYARSLANVTYVRAVAGIISVSTDRLACQNA